MSLTREQRKQTSKELKANYQVSGLTPENIKADLGLNNKQLEETLALGIASDGVTVWRLRDYNGGEDNRTRQRTLLIFHTPKQYMV